MGYFTQQIYNQPESMYVDPRLDILANAAGAIQQRHDKALAEMSAYDIMGANIKVAEGDDAYKRQKIAELQAASKSIADSGDYALAQPRINLAAKGFMADENLIAMQENAKLIDAHNKRREELGANALDFNPANNWQTIDAATGKARKFTSQVEAKLDWDKAAQDVTRIMANERPIGLSDAAVRGYLQSGSASGISKGDVEAYLGKAFNRFANTSEGGQMYRKLTKIDGKSHGEAQREILNYVHSVADAQVHSKVKYDYQVNQPAMQEDSQSHSMEMQQRGFNHDKEMYSMQSEAETERYKLKIAAEEAEAKAKAVADMVISPSAQFSLAASTSNVDGSFGTTAVTEDLVNMGLTPMDIKDGENKYPGVLAPMDIATFGHNPELAASAGNFAPIEIKMAKEYFSQEAKRKKLEGEIKELNKWRQDDNGKVRTGDPFKMDATYNAKKKKLDELNKEMSKFTPKDVQVATKYKTALAGDAAAISESVGQKLNGWRVPALPDNSSRTNSYRVDGELYTDMVAKLPGKELAAKLSKDEIAWMKKNGMIDSDESQILFGDGLEDTRVYNVKFSTKLPSSSSVNSLYNNKVLGTTTASKNTSGLAEQEAQVGQILQDKQHKMNGMSTNVGIVLDRTTNQRVPFRQIMKDRAFELIDATEGATPEQKAKAKELVGGPIDNFDQLSTADKERVIKYLQDNGL